MIVDGTVRISPDTARFLDHLGIGDFSTTMDCETMARVFFILRQLPDREQKDANDYWFPKGKWATIQAIEGQLDANAKKEAEEIYSDEP